jgi:hypothetical protein
MMTAPGPTRWARMPVGGWQVGFWADADGRTLIDVADRWGTLAYRVAGARRAAPSIDAGWAGCASGPNGSSQCWALAIGHLPAGIGYTVSFEEAAQEAGHDRKTETTAGLRLANDGLWVAAAIGRYTRVRLTAQSTVFRYPLRMVAE